MVATLRRGTIPRSTRNRALVLKLVITAFGAIILMLAVGFVYDGLVSTAQGGERVGDVIAVVGAFAAVMSGAALVAALPESVRARFAATATTTSGSRQVRSRPVYGFFTVLAVGVGSTIGSPLFVIIPLNILQYEFVSLGSLVLATVLSVLMAKVYAEMYVQSERRGLQAVGGPSFTRVACGTRSARYFISRVSMWIANTALAAYSKLVFLVFDVGVLPGILASYGVGQLASLAIVYSVAVVFIGWSVLNVVLERRILRSVGYLQMTLTAVMVFILVYQSLLLGSAGSWNLKGLMDLGTTGNWEFALIVNTGYLYLLFFGFQEIQALERDVHSESRIGLPLPGLRGVRVKKSRYLGIAMIASVVVAAVINVLYGVSVFALHPSLSVLSNSQIPALYLAEHYLGPGQELLTAVAFLVATVTTFVPAFVAASRHLGALGEDGYVPGSVSRLSWVFTLAMIFMLAIGNADFLVEITDFLVLISLGIITLSAIWLRKRPSLDRRNTLPLVVGGSCFVAGAAIYFLDPRVVVFGVAAVAFTYLVFDVLELGVFGTQLFLSILDMMCIVSLLLLSPGQVSTAGPILGLLGVNGGGEQRLTILVGILLLSSGMLLLNLVVDARMLRRVESVVRPLRPGPESGSGL